MSINLSRNLHEKMEYTILEYIKELEVEGVIKKGEEIYDLNKNNNLNINNNLSYEAFMIYVLFDNNSTLPIYNRKRLFNKISNKYFIEEDKNELRKYYYDLINVRWRRKRTKILLKTRYDFMYMIAHMFATTNKKFTMDSIELITTNVTLK